MRLWVACLLINLALVLGVTIGYVQWGQRPEPLFRQAETAPGAPARPAEAREWRVNGVVRAPLPEINVIVLTHEDIPGYMASMTMGFRTVSPEIQAAVRVGDEVRFTLRGVPPDVAVTAIERLR